MRPSLALAVLLAAALATPASATSCNLLVDPPGDQDVAEPALDLRSADVASDAKEMTVAIRLADLTDLAPMSPVGRLYILMLRIGETRLEFAAALAAGRPPEFGVRGKTVESTGNASVELAGPEVSSRVRGVVDTAREEVRITVPLADLARFGATRRGARAYELYVRASHTVPVATYTFYASSDSGETERSYRLGSPSCLAVGK